MIDIKATAKKKMFEKDMYRIYSVTPTHNVGAVEVNKYGTISILGEVQELTIGEEYSFTLAPDKRNQYGLSYKILKVKRDIDISNLGNCENFLKEVLTERQCKNILAVYPNFIQKAINNDEDIDISLIKGVGKKTLEKIKRKIVDNFVLIDFAEKYAPYGITFNMISKLYQKYASLDVLENKLLKEPYKTLLAIDRVGFKTADDIILKINPSYADTPQRMDECIKFALQENEKAGSTYIKKDDLFNTCAELTPECIHLFAHVLKESKYVHIDKKYKCIALKTTYETELNVFNMLREMNNQKTIWDCDCTKFINVGGFDLTVEQQEPVKNICNNNLYILGGIPGSGKTFSSKAVIDMCNFYNKKFLLFAPTGKASKVLSDNVSEKASTIHQGLGYIPEQGFQYNENNKLDADIILVDEFSMVDIFLMEHLLKAIDRTKTKLLLIGDFSQLPSVSAGNVANDMVNTGVVPKTLLDKVFRYAEGGLSMCVEKLRNGKQFLAKDKSTQIFGTNKDYIFMEEAQETMVLKTVELFLNIVKENSVEDVIILSSYNKGDYGVKAINKAIQEAYNHNPVFIKNGNDVFKVNDKVMQTTNNYSATQIIDGKQEEGYIFNGSIGIITDIQNDTIQVLYDGKIIQYEKDELSQLTLAYAISVHKSQGISSPYVIFLTPPAHTYMLSRALLYVGLTRAKKRVFHLGTVKTVNLAIKKIDAKNRNTFLLHFLSDYAATT